MDFKYQIDIPTVLSITVLNSHLLICTDFVKCIIFSGLESDVPWFRWKFLDLVDFSQIDCLYFPLNWISIQPRAVLRPGWRKIKEKQFGSIIGATSSFSDKMKRNSSPLKQNQIEIRPALRSEPKGTLQWNWNTATKSQEKEYASTQKTSWNSSHHPDNPKNHNKTYNKTRYARSKESNNTNDCFSRKRINLHTTRSSRNTTCTTKSITKSMMMRISAQNIAEQRGSGTLSADECRGVSNCSIEESERRDEVR